MPFDTKDPKRDHSFDNHPCEVFKLDTVFPQCSPRNPALPFLRVRADATSPDGVGRVQRSLRWTCWLQGFILVPRSGNLTYGWPVLSLSRDLQCPRYLMIVAGCLAYTLRWRQATPWHKTRFSDHRTPKPESQTPDPECPGLPTGYSAHIRHSQCCGYYDHVKDGHRILYRFYAGPY